MSTEKDEKKELPPLAPIRDVIEASPDLPPPYFLGGCI